MGCDIYAFLEVEDRTSPGAYQPLFSGEARLPRDYRVFAALAGVWLYEPERPLFPARGLPGNLSPEIFDQYYAMIIDERDLSAYNGFTTCWCRTRPRRGGCPAARRHMA